MNDKQAYPYSSDVFPNHDGLTRRELFAAMMLQGLVSQSSELDYSVDEKTEDAILLADSLIANLDNP